MIATAPLSPPGSAAVAAAARALYGLGAQSVWLFGSLATGRVDGRSDIDLVVTGLPEDVVAAAGAGLTARLGRRVDIVAMESLPAGLRASVLRAHIPLARNDPAAIRRAGAAVPVRPWARSLHELRHEVVHGILREHGVRTVLDLGCGTGGLLARLAADPHFDALTGVDLDDAALARARAVIRAVRPGVSLLHGLITHRDPALLGHAAATAVEVIEHLDEPRRAAFERVLLDYLRPELVVVTTPNADYNPRFGLPPRAHRVQGHRFEWSRAQFAGWLDTVSRRFGYLGAIRPVGAVDPDVGPPTQLAVLTRTGGAR